MIFAKTAGSRCECIKRRENSVHGEYVGFLRNYSNGSIPRDVPARADPKWYVSSKLLRELCSTPLNGRFKDMYRKPQLYIRVVITKHLLHLDWQTFWNRLAICSVCKKETI